MGFPFVGFEVVVGYKFGFATGGFDGFLVLLVGS